MDFTIIKFISLLQKTPSEFNAESKRYCDVCKTDVKIGTGGEANWKRHTESNAHVKRANELAAAAKRPLSTFFGAASASSSREQLTAPRPSSNLSGNTALFSAHAEALPGAKGNQEVINVDSLPGTSHTAASTPTAGLLASISLVASRLPTAVPLATSTDVLAQFHGDPAQQIEDGDDAWETIDRTLNRVIGYGQTMEDIAAIIRRGPFGIDGFIGWLRSCITTLKIDEALLENKVQRVIDAMVSV